MLIYIVIAACIDGDSNYIIDSVWTSHRKAEKRCKEINSMGLEWLLENFSCGLFDVERRIKNDKRLGEKEAWKEDEE